ncbi:ATP-dependent RNA helicase DDX42 [Trichostrongylus colubriformis]|uniref:RNA helicase n=1 Tax=Trichostrongylus colubriformis TaxID=6319 RepID=A0AAN8IW59_TRICO
MSYRGNYQSRFVTASSSGSATSSVCDDRSWSTTSSMNCVPPPQSLTTTSGPALVAGAFMSAREREKKKEEEYANLMYYGAKTEKEARKKRIYDDERLCPPVPYVNLPILDTSRARIQMTKSRLRHRRHVNVVVAGMTTVGTVVIEIVTASKDKAIAVQKEKDRVSGKDADADKKGIGRADIDEEDMQESYFKYLEEHKEKMPNEEEEYEYDEDGNVIWTWKKVIDPLPPVDHSAIAYPTFNKNFYEEHEEIKKLNHVEVMRLREKLGLRVGGFNPPKPVCSFAHFGFDKQLMDSIRKSEYEHPTPIQAMAIPAALSGRDVLGIAKTGSGKTAAYLWPAIIHIMDQPDLEVGDGPIALVVVPTRELAIQVYQEAKRFCKVYNINVICAYGGGSKWEQSNELKNEGAELVVCTPVKAQVKSISDHIRPDRQCLMFSATFKHKVERLARDALCDPVRIVQGELGEANADVEQTVEVLPRQDTKWVWLTERLVNFGTMGKVLIFVTKKVNAEDLAKKLKARDFDLVLLHGDMLQHERNEHLQAFRKKVNIMVATDVAARGLDIPEIRTVVNYDLARDIDTHVHRVGRTGRAGQKGRAYTLITDKDMEMAGHLVRNLESVNQEVPQALYNLAMKSAWFRSQRGGGSSVNPRARLGLGYKPKTRPAPGSGGSAPAGPFEGAQSSWRNESHSARCNKSRNEQSQSFAATFKPSELESSKLRPQIVSDPRPEWKRKIDEINAKIQAEGLKSQSTATPSATNDDDSSSSKKRSRWQ